MPAAEVAAVPTPEPVAAVLAEVAAADGASAEAAEGEPHPPLYSG